MKNIYDTVSLIKKGVLSAKKVHKTRFLVKNAPSELGMPVGTRMPVGTARRN